MNVTLKNLTLTAALISFSVSAYASSGIKDFMPDLKNPAKAAELKALLASDNETAKSLLDEVVKTNKDSGSRCAAINALALSPDETVRKALAAAINDSDPEVQACAVRAAGESKNEEAAETLLATVEAYSTPEVTKGPYEEDLKARLKAMDSIWSLGEIGNPKVMAKLLKLFDQSDDILKINMAISAGKTKSEHAGKFLYKIAGANKESAVVRAAAYEMLEASKMPAPSPEASAVVGMEKGDLIFTGGIFGRPQPLIGDLPIGHAGLFGGTEVRDGKLVVVIYDCVPDSFKPYGGVRKIFSFTNFTHKNMYAFYGNRVSSRRPSAAQRELIIKAAIAKLGNHYSDTHFSQKGPVDFDCVGYTEYAYEAAGLNPTPDDQESGWGWPLTPAEQFAATTANVRGRSVIVMPNPGNTTAPQRPVILPNQAIIDHSFGYLTGALGMKGVQAPEVDTNIQPVLVN